MNDRKLPDQLKFFSGEEKEENLLKTHAHKKVSVLNKGNEEFLEYLASKYGRDVLQKNKLKIHLESGEIYLDNINTGESIYNFLRAQEDFSKRFLNLDINLTGDLEYYIKEILDRVTDDKFDVHINSTSKFLFYRFNNFRQLFGLSTFAIRHTQISDDRYALKILQNKNWPYFVKTVLELSNDNVDLSSVTDQNEINIINETFENLNICKEYCNSVYNNIAGCFEEYLNKIPTSYVEEVENDLNINLYSNIDIKNEQSPAEIFKLFDKFILNFSTFPAVDTLAIVPTGVVPSFVKTDDILSPFDLYKNFNSTDAHGLVCVQFLAALNVFLGSDKIISKSAMSEFFHNLSMQALNKMIDKVKLKFDAINDLNKNINNLLITEANKFKTLPKEIRMGNFADHKTENEKFEDGVVTNILYDFKVEYPDDTDHLTFPNSVDEIKNRLLMNLDKKTNLILL